MTPELDAQSLVIRLSQFSCDHNHSSEPDITCPNITSLTATLQQELTTIGTIKSNLLNKGAMDAIGPAEMWLQCQAYDEANATASQLNKVENFLTNQEFPADRTARIDAAEWVLYIEEAFIEPPFRRQGLSLLALDLLIKELEVGNRCVVLLQAGSIVRFERYEESRTLDVMEACEKITSHWKRMGFSEWSDSDDAWLCLLTGERPMIEDVVPELFPKTWVLEDPKEQR